MKGVSRVALAVALLALALAPALCEDASDIPSESKGVHGNGQGQGSKTRGAHAASPSAASGSKQDKASGTSGGMDTALLGGIVVAVVVGSAGVYFIFFAGEAKPRFKGDAVFLIGPCGGGKTSIFFKLYNGGDAGTELRQTQTSMIKNECTVTPEVQNNAAFFCIFNLTMTIMIMIQFIIHVWQTRILEMVTQCTMHMLHIFSSNNYFQLHALLPEYECSASKEHYAEL